MLQQTTVAAVIPYHEKFLTRFPDVTALAAAPEGEVMAAWAGLGYYARARNLHACARAIAASGGVFPATMDALRALPGIGPYTATAIAAIAFGLPGIPVDGNVERVAARIFAIETPLPGGRREIAGAGGRLGEDPAAAARPSDFAQALFDLGATICTPKNPDCLLCPWQESCAGRRSGLAARLPRREPKRARPIRHGVTYFLEDSSGRVLLRRRPPRGLFGGMTELPGTEWRATPWRAESIAEAAPMPATWRSVGEVRHGLTHFELRLDVFAARVPEIEADGFLVDTAALAREALPSVMRKCVALAVAR